MSVQRCDHFHHLIGRNLTAAFEGFSDCDCKMRTLIICKKQVAGFSEADLEAFGHHCTIAASLKWGLIVFLEVLHEIAFE
jgi:hypothetical protein